MSLQDKMTSLMTVFEEIASNVENETSDNALQMESVVKFCDLIREIIDKRKNDLNENPPEPAMLAVKIEHCDDVLEMVDDLIAEMEAQSEDEGEPDDVFDYFVDLELILTVLMAPPTVLPPSESS